MSARADKTALLASLERIDSPPQREDDELLRRLSLATALPALTEIDHEKELRVCHGVAAHLLEQVPEPEEVEVD